MSTYNVNLSNEQIAKLISNYDATANNLPCQASGAIPTGFQDFDDILGGGYQAGSLTIISGDAGSGKTTLLENSAKRMLAAGTRVLYVSSEQDTQTLLAQLIHTGLGFTTSSADIRRGDIPTEHADDFAHALKFFSGRNLCLVSCHTAEDIRTAAEKFHPHALIVDSIQGLIGGKANTDIFQETARNISALNAVAINLGIAVVVVSHANREGRKSGLPLQNHNLSNSGQIEYLASAIVFVRQVPDKDAKEAALKNELDQFAPEEGHLLELRVSKSRLRDCSHDQTCFLLWQKGLTSIKDSPRSVPPADEDTDSELRARCRAIVDAYNSLKEGGPNAGSEKDQIR